MNKIITLQRGEIHLWYTSIKSHQRDLNRYQQLLSPPERKRVEKLRFKKSRRRSIVCRGILREILSRYTGKPPRKLEIGLSETGKPFLPHASVQFNLSHSEDHMICAVTNGNPIGIDLQAVFEIHNMDTIVNFFFSLQEKQHYEQLKKDAATEFFFKTWVRKEAFMKATGLGFHLPSKHFSTIKTEEGKPHLYFHDQHPISFKEWSIWDIPVQPGSKAALALQGEIKDVQHFNYGHDVS